MILMAVKCQRSSEQSVKHSVAIVLVHGRSRFEAALVPDPQANFGPRGWNESGHSMNDVAIPSVCLDAAEKKKTGWCFAKEHKTGHHLVSRFWW